MSEERPQAAFAIHDLTARPLAGDERPSGTHLPALRFNDHWLRRFGLAEVVRIHPESAPQLHLREAADEAWALIEGAVEFIWHDLRPGSPTYDRWDRLGAREPVVVLVPFGVAFGVRSIDSPTWVLRLATHEDGEPEGDRWLPWPVQAV